MERVTEMPPKNFEETNELFEKEYTSLPITNSAIEFKINVPVDFQRKVEYLHMRYPNREWGGFAFAKVNNPEISSDLVIELVDFYPLNLGTPSFTSYEQDEDFAGFLADNIDYIDYKLVYLHSHHKLGAFHSDTDTNTLKRLTALCKSVIYVVVDTTNTWWGHISVLVENKIKITRTSSGKKWYDLNNGMKEMALDTPSDSFTETIQKSIMLYKGNFNYAPLNPTVSADYMNLVTGMEKKSAEKESLLNKGNNIFNYNQGITVSPPPQARIGIHESGGLLNQITPHNNNAWVSMDHEIDFMDKTSNTYTSLKLTVATVMILKSFLEGTTNFKTNHIRNEDIQSIKRNWVTYFDNCITGELYYDSPEFIQLAESLIDELDLESHELLITAASELSELYEIVESNANSRYTILAEALSSFGYILDNYLNEDEEEDYGQYNINFGEYN